MAGLVVVEVAGQIEGTTTSRPPPRDTGEGWITRRPSLTVIGKGNVAPPSVERASRSGAGVVPKPSGLSAAPWACTQVTRTRRAFHGQAGVERLAGATRVGGP